MKKLGRHDASLVWIRETTIVTKNDEIGARPHFTRYTSEHHFVYMAHCPSSRTILHPLLSSCSESSLEICPLHPCMSEDMFLIGRHECPRYASDPARNTSSKQKVLLVIASAAGKEIRRAARHQTTSHLAQRVEHHVRQASPHQHYM